MKARLRLHVFFMFAGVFLLLGAYMGAIEVLPARDGDEMSVFNVLIALFSLLLLLGGGYSMLMYINYYVQIDEEGILISNWNRKKVFVPWNTIEKVAYKSGRYKYVFYTSEGVFEITSWITQVQFLWANLNAKTGLVPEVGE